MMCGEFEDRNQTPALLPECEAIPKINRWLRPNGLATGYYLFAPPEHCRTTSNTFTR
jgi:hypothetical protein